MEQYIGQMAAAALRYIRDLLTKFSLTVLHKCCGISLIQRPISFSRLESSSAYSHKPSTLRNPKEKKSNVDKSHDLGG